MNDKDTDQALVERVQKGDKAAFDLLVLKYQSRIAALISRFVSDDHDVQDVTQEAFIKAYRALANFRGDSAFYTWMYRIAINTAKNHLVKTGRKVPATDVDAQQAEQFDDGVLLQDVATPERELVSEEVGKAVSETIEGLPEELRTAIMLREIDGLSYDEIARVMDCPVGTVRSRIFRAREAVDKKLESLLY